MSPINERHHWETWGAAVVVSIAVLSGLAFKGISGETLSDAVKDIGGALIPILAAFVAARIITNQMDPAERFKLAGEEALCHIQKKYPDILSGPKANRESYDSENPGKAGRYLFFQQKAQGRKAQFIPINPFQEGIVEIRISKTTTLIILGAGHEKFQQEIQLKVREAVLRALKQDWRDTFEVLEPNNKHQDIVIQVDFDESNIGPKRFKQAVITCAESAIKEIIQITSSLKVA